MRKERTPFITCFVVLAAVLALGLSACTQESFVPPEASTIGTAPPELTALQLWNDYQADPMAAAAKYEGKTFHFARVRVDQMSYLGEGMENDLYVQEGLDPKVERVKFRTEKLYEISNIRQDYIVEIIGQPQGTQFGYVIVKISWIRVVDPPGGDTRPPPEY